MTLQWNFPIFGTHFGRKCFLTEFNLVMKKLLYGLAFTGLLGLGACKKDGGGFVLIPLSQDKQLGAQLDQEIQSKPSEYPILDETTHPDAYGHLRRIRDNILNSGEVVHKDDFEWKVTIIDDDNTLNAFAAPGGYIYVYTGIIKYLDKESDFAGVLGHEIAHADQRHSTRQMQQALGLQLLLTVAAGDASESQLAALLSNLTQLQFSRSHEAEADEYSVKYLCPTDYHADGAASFFEKILDENGSQSALEEFLSTHPSPENRVEDIKAEADSKSCGTEKDEEYSNSWVSFQNSL